MEIYNSYSILHDIKSRELHGFKGRKRPLFVYNTSLDDRSDEPSCSRGVESSHDGVPTPPMSVSFAKTIRNAHILGVTDEEGYVNLINTRLKLKPSATHQENAEKAIVSSWVAHDNSVYDICWTKDDTRVLTASADHTIKLWDVEQKKCYGMLRGHVGSVKSVSCHPTNSDLVVSGSRDGSFALWDLRCNPCQGRDGIMSTEQVTGAHTSAKRKRFIKSKAASMTVTSVLYLRDGVSIATAGAVDSVVKFWDTRNLRVPAAQASPLHESMTNTNGRQHGITSLSQDLNGVLLSASCTDNRIYLYNVLQPEKGPISSFTGCQIGSFFIKSSISPDASHILSGSGDGNAYIWQVDDPHQDPISLTSHEKEVTAVDWCLQEPGKIATASDDFTVCFWNVQNRNYLSPRTTAVRRRVMAVSKTDCHEASLQKESPCRTSHKEVIQDQSIVEFKTPETIPNKLLRDGLLPGVNLNEAFDKTPESASRSPSSVLSPPSSLKKRTIRDYFVVC
ncbi:denticleless protein homolog A-like [Chenopodium quinoa]|uniref:denticleless protein homolog A-like n=1 Tax=Chenopodium quinoa TaxID=63459 RepID=UPI000B771427|nr:denticleless protein homolog A-like [Chenopodium quinoa]